MTIAELKEYLKRTIEIEKIIYTQEKTLSALDSKIGSLGKAKKIEIKAERETEGVGGSIIAILWPIIFLGVAIAMFAGGSSCEACYVVGAFPALISLILFWVCISGLILRKKERREAHQEYVDGLIEASVALDEDNARVEKEKVMAKKLKEQRALLQAKCDETKEIRAKLYDLDIIFPKYRNLVALCSFYEYLISGRCSTLEGHEGAYNIFENEIRLNLIIANLQEVVAHLKNIEQNQYMLHAAITESHQKMDRLLDETMRVSAKLDYIADQTEITAQNSRWAAQELETIKWLEIMK